MRNELLKIAIFSLKYSSRNFWNPKVKFFYYICRLNVEQKPQMELLIAACNKCLSFTCILLQRFVVQAHGLVFSDVLIKLYLMADGTCINWDEVDRTFCYNVNRFLNGQMAEASLFELWYFQVIYQ